jgi:hypothetical protein
MIANENTKLMMLNEAHILGTAEAKTKEKRAAGEALVREGKLLPGGTMSSGRSHRWYKPACAPTGRASVGSPRVKFVAIEGELGASEADDLGHVVADTYCAGEEGVLAFEHPNPKACPGWVYVEVVGKSDPTKRFYVGVPSSAIEVISASEPKVAFKDDLGLPVYRGLDLG